MGCMSGVSPATYGAVPAEPPAAFDGKNVDCISFNHPLTILRLVVLRCFEIQSLDEPLVRHRRYGHLTTWPPRAHLVRRCHGSQRATSLVRRVLYPQRADLKYSTTMSGHQASGRSLIALIADEVRAYRKNLIHLAGLYDRLYSSWDW